jgi:ABC-type lipoprotein export system ATPase subunit
MHHDGVAVAFEGVSKRYGNNGGGARAALDGVSFDAPLGRAIAVVGRSGSGKSTLLHLAAGIEVASAGNVVAFGRNLADMSERERTTFRRDTIGLVFQFFHLLPHLSVRENVALPEFIARTAPRAYESRVVHLLERVGLADRSDDPVSHLSGGEMQRVAICRALVRRPRLVLADEPTGNLDDETGEAVMRLMLELVREEEATLLCVTHSRETAAQADAVWDLHSGRLRGS